MCRRASWLALLAFGYSISLAQPFVAEIVADEPGKPNVVVILADDLGAFRTL